MRSASSQLAFPVRLVFSLVRRGRCLRALPLTAALACLLAGAALTEAQSVQTENLGANQVTLELTSSTTGTGYFTLLPGNGATCGSAAQTAVGEDNNGNVAIHGSLPLTANVQAQYTVRNLMGSTAYTICFTPDGSTGPVATSFTTAVAAAYSPGAWEAVGNLGFTSGFSGAPSFAFAPDGTPYVAYQDGASGKASVMAFKGAAWAYVGSAGFSPGVAPFVSLAFAPDGTPFVAFQDNANNEAATVMKFNGSAWVIVGNAGFTPGEVISGVRLAFAPDGTPYVAFNDTTNNKEASVMKFNGTAWVYVGAADFSPGEALIGSIAFAPDGAPYVAFGDGANGYGTTVMEFNGTSWVTLGLTDLSNGQSGGESLAFGPDGTPYVAFLDAAQADKATVKEYDSSLSTWVTLGGANFSPVADAVSLAIGPDGTPYVAIEDRSNNYAASAMKYNGTSWVNAGNADFSVGSTGSEALAIAPDGTPYVAFTDAAVGGGESVMALTSAVQATVTAWPAASAITYGETLADSTLSGGSASVPGTFAWVDSALAPLTGAPSQNVAFTPNNTASFAPVYGSVSVTVNPAVPAIVTAPAASSIVQGEALSDSILSGGAASVPGSFAWTSPSTVMSTAGSISESVTFTPNDSFDYTTVTLNVSVPVFSAAPAFTNVGANQVTLELASEFSDPGEFTLLQGSNATCGTATQTYEGQDSNGNMVIHGSVYLNAEVQGQYTVRNLMASTSYTACFTLDGASGPLSSSFTTAAAAMYNSPTWAVVGSADFSPGQTNDESLAFAPNGAPYVAFEDGASSGKATVMEFNGAAWATVGSAGFSPGEVFNPSLAFAPNGTPCVAFEDVQNGSKETVMEFNGSAWVNVGSPDFSPGGALYESLAFAPDGTPYVAFGDVADGYKAMVMEFNGTSWVNVGSPDFSAGEADNESLAFSPDGTPTLAFADDANGSEATVMAFNGTAWVNLGNADFSPGGTLFESLAVSPDGTPYLAFADGANRYKATVMKFNGAAWSIVGSAGFAPNSGPGATLEESLAISPGGTPYVAFEDCAGGCAATVMAFNGTAWANVSSPDFSPGESDYMSLAFAPDGTPYVAFEDSPNDDKATVMRLTNPGPVAPTITAWPTASPIAYGQTLAASTLSGGTASVPGTFAWTDSTIMPGVGVQSESVTFTPEDATGYTTVTGSVSVTVMDTFSYLTVTGVPPAAYPGTAYTATVTAIGASGAVFSGFTGTVTLTSTDPAASFNPAAYTFQPADSGVHSFSVTFGTGGTQTLTATSGPSTASETGIVVGDYIWTVSNVGGMGQSNEAGNILSSNPAPAGTAGLFGGIAFDNSGTAYSVVSTYNGIARATSNGTGESAFTGGGLNAPVAIAVDGAGIIWVANSGNNSVSEFTNTGTSVSDTSGMASSSVTAPSAIAVDSTGSVWVTNRTAATVTKLFGAAMPVVSPLSTAAGNNQLGITP